MLPDIGLLGAKRAGKDTIADYLVREYGYQKLSFAEPLRQLAAEINPTLPASAARLPDGPRYFNEATDMFGYEYAKDNVDGYREFLENLGVGARRILGDDVWVGQLLETYYVSDSSKPTVVTDCRFPNEAEALYKQVFTLVHVVREDAGDPGSHESESHVESLAKEYKARLLHNSGDLDTLYSNVDKLVNDYWKVPTRG